jgi:hypothetical protein
VKLINFGLPAMASDTKLQSANSETPEQVSTPEQFVSSEQSTPGTTDIRSKIYSLGAALYFLLTGVALFDEVLKGGPKLSKFPKPLRTLLARMLHRDPDQRPKDLVVLAEMIRQCLQKIERRRALADKYGIPYRTTFPPRAQAPSRPLLRIALPIAALLLAAAVLAAVLSPEPISRIIHPNRETKKLGVLVGVPESSPSAVQNASTPIPPAAVASQETTAAVPSSTQPPANVATASNSPQVPPPDVQQAQTTTDQSQAAAANASEATSPPAIAESSSSPPGETNPSSKSAGGSQAATASQSSSQSKKKSVASASRRARRSQTMPEDLTQRGTRSVRARVVGITSDGRFILRLPSGRTAIIAPDSDQDEFVPRRHRRAYIGRDEMSGPPPQFEPDFFPND